MESVPFCPMSTYLGFVKRHCLVLWLGNPRLAISVSWAVIPRGKRLLQHCWGLLGKLISPKDPTNFPVTAHPRGHGSLSLCWPQGCQSSWSVRPGWDCWGVLSPLPWNCGHRLGLLGCPIPQDPDIVLTGAASQELTPEP